jgi:eukaryotic-like serine/threonine-protein kinase
VQLESGTRLGPYEIVERVGAGGMGEVYRARDTRLSRSVAVKVLPAEFAANARLRSRFEREAKAISALNDPHICALYDLGRENDVDYLVFEFCEGNTLAHRLERGPLPVEQVLQFGIEIAEALSRAHRAGIIHRDLKPSNIMLTKSGVKLLDFGLAEQRPDGRLGESRETTSLRGEIAGTVQYMAPELLNGGEANAGSDIFALGLVLHEMLSAKPAFPGISKASVIAAILEREPEPLPESTPPALAYVITKCLSKQPDERWESAHDVAGQLRWMRVHGMAVAAARQRRPYALLAIAALALLASLAAIAILNRPAGHLAVARLTIPLGQDETAIVTDGGTPNVAISPDGARIAYVAVAGDSRRIFLRTVDSFVSAPLEMADIKSPVFGPFFSPDGQWVGFTSFGKLMKVERTGGVPKTILGGFRGTARGAAWGPDGTIYFSPGATSGIWRLPAGASSAQPLTSPNSAAGENSHRWPSLLPDGKHLLFTIRTDRISSFDDAKIAVLSLENNTWKVVVEGGSCARFAPSGHLLFARAGALYAVPFDLKSLTVTGPRRKVIDGLLTSPVTGAAHYSLTSGGDIVYLPGGAGNESTEMFSVDFAGRAMLTTKFPFGIEAFKISPDGRQLALHVDAANDEIRLYDISSGVTTRLSFGAGDEGSPLWTPDGTRIISSSISKQQLLIRKADGSAETEELLPKLAVATSSSPDGKLLTCVIRDPVTGLDIYLLPMTGERKPYPLLRTPFNEAEPRFSPDGKWIAYQSDESGSNEIYVRAGTPGGGRWKLSAAGGVRPRWSMDGTQVFYQRDGVYAVRISFAGNEVHPEQPRLLFKEPLDPTYYDQYEVSKNGFLVVRESRDIPRVRQINIILNFGRELNP